MLWYASYYDERAFVHSGPRRHDAGIPRRVDARADTRPALDRRAGLFARWDAVGVHRHRSAERKRTGAIAVAARCRDQPRPPVDLCRQERRLTALVARWLRNRLHLGS